MKLVSSQSNCNHNRVVSNTMIVYRNETLFAEIIADIKNRSGMRRKYFDTLTALVEHRVFMLSLLM